MFGHHLLKTLGKALLVLFAASTAAFSAAGQAASASAGSCKDGYAYIPGLQDQTVQNPVGAFFRAFTANNCRLTAVRFYLDSQTFDSYPVNLQFGGFGSLSSAIPDGYHTFVGVAWNQDGYAFRTQDFRVFVAGEDKTVYINSPSDGSSQEDPVVHFNVRTRYDIPSAAPDFPSSENAVVHIRLYVDNQITYDIDGTYLDTIRAFSKGTHSLVVVAYLKNGYTPSYISKASTFTIQ